MIKSDCVPTLFIFILQLVLVLNKSDTYEMIIVKEKDYSIAL